jgi:hypothetical protein
MNGLSGVSQIKLHKPRQRVKLLTGPSTCDMLR